jgi:hypothetical protein
VGVTRGALDARHFAALLLPLRHQLDELGVDLGDSLSQVV